jgi:two-component sensor histidine kinase
MSEVTLQVESNLQAPGKSRSRLAALKPQLEPRFDDVILVVSELVSNSVRHGAPGDVDVMVSAQDDYVRVEVSDDGEGFEPGAPRGEGLGLTLVDKIARSWGVSNNGRFTVWAEIPKTEPGAI